MFSQLDIGQLFQKLCVPRKLEGPAQVRLDVVHLPQAIDRAGTHTMSSR
jgi:hypothetical protein